MNTEDLNSTHPAYCAGRCNAKRKKHPGKLCRRYPLAGAKRCSRHGGGWSTGTRNRTCERVWPYRKLSNIATQE